MKKIVAVNGSPRSGWNTDILVREAAKGAESKGAEVEVIDLYKLDKFTGCVSCFGCKLGKNKGKCVCRDGLAPVLEKIRGADGLILGSPIYLGNITAGLRALYERLIFQYITYSKEVASYAGKKIPVTFIVTSNAPAESYGRNGYDEMIASYKGSLESFVGPTKVLISADTLQVDDYSRFEWSRFDPEAKKKRREEVFPGEREAAFALGAEMVE